MRSNSSTSTCLLYTDLENDLFFWLHECVFVKLLVGLRAKYGGLIIATELICVSSVYNVFVGKLKTTLYKYSLTLFLFNPLKTKRRPLYLKTQSVPRCKHFSSRL
jgi:hypothetical protein